MHFLRRHPAPLPAPFPGPRSTPRAINRDLERRNHRARGEWIFKREAGKEYPDAWNEGARAYFDWVLSHKRAAARDWLAERGPEPDALTQERINYLLEQQNVR